MNADRPEVLFVCVHNAVRPIRDEIDRRVQELLAD